MAAAQTMLASTMPSMYTDDEAAAPVQDFEVRQRVAAKREATRMKRWRHRAVNTPLNGVGLHHLMALSDRDWRRWPRVGGGGHRDGLDNSGVMVFTAEDFDSDSVDDCGGDNTSGVSGEGTECGVAAGSSSSSGIYYGSSSGSSSSSDSDSELSDDWEDPLWVKDENVRTEGRCDWTRPRPLQVIRQAEPEDDEVIEQVVVGVKTAKKNESDGNTKAMEDDGMDDAEHLVSSNELSWIISGDSRQNSSEEVVMELEEQDAEEEDLRTRARGGTESSYERGAEYLLQKYFCSLPTFPTRAGSRISTAQQVISQRQQLVEEETAVAKASRDEIIVGVTQRESSKPATKSSERKQQQQQQQKKTKAKKEKAESVDSCGKKVAVPRIEGLALDEHIGDDDKTEKRHRKRKNKSSTSPTPTPTPRTPRTPDAAESTTPASSPPAISEGTNIKGIKGGRNLVSLFNLSPRRRDVTKRRSSFIRRRSVEEEAEAAAHEAALRHLQQQQRLHAEGEEEDDEELDDGEQDGKGEWPEALRKPRRKRSISIPLAAYRLELELSLKSALSRGEGKSESGSGGSSSKTSSLARRLRRKGSAAGLEGDTRQPTPSATASSSKKSRKGHKFATITSMTDTRKFYFMDEFEECDRKKKGER